MLRLVIFIGMISAPLVISVIIIMLILGRIKPKSDDVSTITRKPDYHYYNSDYYLLTQTPYKKILEDKGIQGEYLCYNCLKQTAGYKKFVFNAYLPTDTGTTEIDLIMIHGTGIYVIESKNLDGLIKGHSGDIKWTQYFRGHKRYSFYNPIRQNDRHIEELKKHLPVLNEEAYKSIIVFNPLSNIKEIANETNAKAVKRNELIVAIEMILSREPNRFKEEHIDRIQDILLQFTYKSDDEKSDHIQNIRCYKK